MPVDEVVRAYGDSYPLPPEEDGRLRIGYVYLTVRFQSFLDPGMRPWSSETFTDLAATVAGVCCQFDRGDRSPGDVCWVSGEADFPSAPSSS